MLLCRRMGLRTSIVAGVCAAVLSLVSFLVDFPQVTNASAALRQFGYFETFAVLLCYAAYVHGFAVIGRRQSSNLLVIASYTLIIIIFGSIALILLGSFGVLGDTSRAAVILATVIVCRSSAELLLGKSLWNVRSQFGTIGLWTAITGISLGCAGFLLGNVDLVRIPFLLCGSWLFVQATASPHVSEKG